jgi:hypothetical protein
MRGCSSSAREEKSLGVRILPLNDGEIDLLLIDPTGMYKGVDEDGIGPLVA